MQFTETPTEPFGRMLLDMPLENNLGYKTPLVFRVMKLLRDHDYLPDYGYHMAEVSLEEALCNAIIHGNRLDPTKTVKVQVFGDGTRFGIAIEDEGNGFRPEDVPDPTDPENLYREHGRGILLMNHYMDSVEYNQRGNRVCLVRDRQTEPDPGAHPPKAPPMAVVVPEDGVIEAEVFEGADTEDGEVVEPPDVEIPDDIELDLGEPADSTATPVSEGAVTLISDSGVTIAVIGEQRVTEDCADEVRNGLLLGADQTGRLVIDMGAVEFMSSIGIAALMGTMKRVSTKKGQMVLCNVQPAVVNILEATGLLRILNIQDDRAAAVAAAAK